METNLPAACNNCSKPLPIVGYFCGACLTQFKCKSCDALLEKDYAGCINCGTPKMSTNTVSQQNINTFRLQETKDGRTIEATFSDNVGKDLAGILRDAASANRMKAIDFKNPHSANNFDGANEEASYDEFQDAQVLNNNQNSINAGSEVKSQPQTSGEEKDYPTLLTIAMRNLPSSETEWIAVYSFYASKFGETMFTRQDIIGKYEESNRLSNDKKSTLSIYLKRAVQANYINALANFTYSIVDTGITKAKEIINRTSSSTSKTPKIRSKKSDNDTIENSAEKKEKSTKKKGLTTGKTYKSLANIDFYPSGQDSLTDFMKKFKVKSNDERNLLFTHYLQTILKIGVVDLNHLYTCYDESGQQIPENMDSSLKNTITRKKWLETKNSAITITTRGTNKIKFWDKKEPS